MAQLQAMSPLSMALTYFLPSSPTLTTQVPDTRIQGKGRGEHEGSLNLIGLSRDAHSSFQRDGLSTETGKKRLEANNGGDTHLDLDHNDLQAKATLLRSDFVPAGAFTASRTPSNSNARVPPSSRRDTTIRVQVQDPAGKAGQETRLLRRFSTLNLTPCSPRLAPKTPSRLRLNSRYSYPAHEPPQIGEKASAAQGLPAHSDCDQNISATSTSPSNEGSASPGHWRVDHERQQSKNMINLHEPIGGKAEYHSASTAPLPKPFTSWNPTTPRLNPVLDMESPSPIFLPSPQLRSEGGFFALFGSERQTDQGMRVVDHTSPLTPLRQRLGDNYEDSSLHSGSVLNLSTLASPIAQSTPWTSIPLSSAIPQSNLGLGLGLCLPPTPALMPSNAQEDRSYSRLIDHGFYLPSSSSISYPFPQVPASPSHVPDASMAGPDSNVGLYWSLTPKETAHGSPTATTPSALSSSPQLLDIASSGSRTRGAHPGISPQSISERPEELYVKPKTSNPPMSPVLEHAVAMVSPIFGRLPASCSGISAVASAAIGQTPPSPKGKQKGFQTSSPLLRSYF
ncbi:hypothetical protein BDN72DRAFT_834902 [Pluteus cervinus]|uniref:Uncharacterized protein n=1 Tax=Pluteus cervinus TaxID=181527 RepID=A0ACD3B6I5_9AGAR|nr:hypothetical protein BDN72DRAFT_834902 [Pluteus cervinus]